MTADKSVKIFISYAREDDDHRERFTKELIAIKREHGDKITWFYDQEGIKTGEIWEDSIVRELYESDIIVFLVSSDFIASEYIANVEIKLALQRREIEDVIFVPVLLKPCQFNRIILKNYKMLPTNGVPISKWANTDEAFLHIGTEIGKEVDYLLDNPNPAPPITGLPRAHQITQKILGRISNKQFLKIEKILSMSNEFWQGKVPPINQWEEIFTLIYLERQVAAIHEIRKDIGRVTRHPDEGRLDLRLQDFLPKIGTLITLNQRLLEKSKCSTLTLRYTLDTVQDRITEIKANLHLAYKPEIKDHICNELLRQLQTELESLSKEMKELSLQMRHCLN